MFFDLTPQSCSFSKQSRDCHRHPYSCRNCSHIFYCLFPIIPHLYSVILLCGHCLQETQRRQPALSVPLLQVICNTQSSLCTGRGPLCQHSTFTHTVFSPKQPGRSFESQSVVSHYSCKAPFCPGLSLQPVQNPDSHCSSGLLLRQRDPLSSPLRFFTWLWPSKPSFWSWSTSNSYPLWRLCKLRF